MKTTLPHCKTKNSADWLLVDFDDSFTYNIVNQLLPLGIRPTVINYRELTYQLDFPEVLILGPGPSHPDEYLASSPGLRNYLQQGRQKIFGICLGHQLICRSFNLTVRQLPNPIHGRAVDIIMPDWSFWPQKKFKVQLYNSLGVLAQDWRDLGPEVRGYFSGGQLLYVQSSSRIGMQFHPESVGTTNSSALFAAVISFFCPTNFVNSFVSKLV